MIYLRLFASFCITGLLSFGGGYAALPLIQEQCVEINHWLSAAEFSDLLTISQITPGPIAINAAAFAGMKAAGIIGSAVASAGFVLPPFIIVTLLFWVYKRYGHIRLVQDILNGFKPATAALVAAAAINIVMESLYAGEGPSLSAPDIFSAALMIAAFIALRKWKPGAILTILACGVLGILRELAIGALLP
jgi:chromate transporter